MRLLIAAFAALCFAQTANADRSKMLELTQAQLSRIEAQYERSCRNGGTDARCVQLAVLMKDCEKQVARLDLMVSRENNVRNRTSLAKERAAREKAMMSQKVKQLVDLKRNIEGQIAHLKSIDSQANAERISAYQSKLDRLNELLPRYLNAAG